MGSENRSGKVPLISKIAYGFGDVGCNFSWMFVSNFLMIFYTDVFGISMAAVSALMLFSRFWDAINDPIVGGLTDKTKTRWGRYRPWLLVAAPITAVLLVMTFWARPDWNQTAKIVYMVITYCLLVLGYTCVNIPYGTLCGAMTQDIDERAKINTSRSVAAMIAIGVLNIITVPLINKFGSSSAKTGYLTVAVIYGCIFAACHFFCFAKTKEAVITPEKEKISIKVQLKAVLQNRPYLLALVGQILFGFTLYGRNADVLYYFTYVEGNASYYTTYSMCIIIPSIIGAACFQPVFRKLNNKGRTASVFALLTGISMLSMFFFNVKEAPVIFYALSTLNSSILQGLGKVNTPIINAGISLVVQTVAAVLLLMFTSLDLYSIAIANTLYSGMMCVLNQWAVRRAVGYRQEIVKTFVIPVFASAFMGAAAWAIYEGLYMVTKSMRISVIPAIMIAAVVYFVMLILMRGITEQELRSFPKGYLLVKVAKKCRLLR